MLTLTMGECQVCSHFDTTSSCFLIMPSPLDVSIVDEPPKVLPRAKGKRKAVAVEVVDEDSDDGWEAPTTIPWRTKVVASGDFWPGFCNPTSWESSKASFCEVFDTSHGTPHFGWRSADQGSITGPLTIIRNEGEWLSLMKDVMAREKKVFLQSITKKGSAKSMLPLYIGEWGRAAEVRQYVHYLSSSPSNPKLPQPTATAKKGKPGAAVPLTKAQRDLSVVQARLQGAPVQAIGLTPAQACYDEDRYGISDAGYRNLGPLPYAAPLQPKGLSHDEAMAKIDEKYTCTTHHGRQCWVPPSGHVLKYVGEHINFTFTIRETYASYLVSFLLNSLLTGFEH
jgi:hypothetical protein